MYRIRRIEELLGVELSDPAAVFDLTLAFRIRDVLADSTPRPDESPAGEPAPARSVSTGGERRLS